MEASGTQGDLSVRPPGTLIVLGPALYSPPAARSLSIPTTAGGPPRRPATPPDTRAVRDSLAQPDSMKTALSGRLQTELVRDCVNAPVWTMRVPGRIDGPT